MPYAANRIVIHYADIALKGRNRPHFETLLARQVAARIARLGLDWPVGRAAGRMHIEIGAQRERLDEVLAVLAEIPGIATFFPARWFAPADAGRSQDGLATGPLGATLLELARATHRPGERFAMRVERHDPGFRVSTRELESIWGTAVLAETPWEGVNLSAPDRVFHVSLYRQGAVLYGERRHGIGGMPVGSSGRLVALLSGGIDSPVATFLMARRGCTIDCLHFSANYLDRDRAAASPIGRLAARLSRYTQKLALHVVPYVPFDLALAGAHTGYELVLFRRFMLRCAETLAARQRASALVTGDSLSQVASQTLENLLVVDHAVSLPVFRPLIGFNKDEIVAWARRLGTYELSIQPYKDCCALVARGPKTRARLERVLALEGGKIPDYGALVDAALAEAASFRFEAGELVDPVPDAGAARVASAPGAGNG